MVAILFVLLLALCFILYRTTKASRFKIASKRDASLLEKRLFFDALIEASAQDYVVLSKVPLAKLITPQMVLLADSSKHGYADFVLCDKETFSAKTIIQLNTSNHLAQAALARGLQYIELSPSNYDVTLLKSALQKALGQGHHFMEEANATSAIPMASKPSQLN